MKNKFNTLRKYILENSVKEYRKETVNGLFRSILNPLISNQKINSCILLRLNSAKEKESVLKRLFFSDSDIFSYNDKLTDFNLINSQIENILDTTEFVLVLSQRYSAALIWDYELSDKKDYTNVCLLYNSKIISDIAKKISENSMTDLKPYIQKYTPDRRENQILNSSISSIAAELNDKNEEIIFSEHEKQHIFSNDDTLQTADIVVNKAKFIAHEIKNNLSIINLYTAIAQKRFVKIDVKDEEIIQSINNSFKNITSASENISAFISDLRCLSAPYKTEVNIKKLILDTVNMCEEKAKNENIKIIVNEIDDYIIISDKTKIQCAMTNIIFNAIEACVSKPVPHSAIASPSPSESSSFEIYIDCFLEQELLKIQIKNNGEEIPENIQEHIFEPNFTTKEKGNGLGLGICKQQLKLAGGEINLICSNKEETVFEIALPL
ncbi:MAG: HAMP domain-containing histidine kinase [Candidatus Gastranaerophilales bacterium]|nr:HAMP domain-containing histidine kinase [Candidatus Gastranaerophilales bacterium]